MDASTREGAASFVAPVSDWEHGIHLASRPAASSGREVCAATAVTVIRHVRKGSQMNERTLCPDAAIV